MNPSLIHAPARLKRLLLSLTVRVARYTETAAMDSKPDIGASKPDAGGIDSLYWSLGS